MASEKKPGRLKRKISQARKRSELVDHLFRTKERYSEAFGSRLAAACAYYGFFAVFALGVVGFAVLLEGWRNTDPDQHPPGTDLADVVGSTETRQILCLDLAGRWWRVLRVRGHKAQFFGDEADARHAGLVPNTLALLRDTTLGHATLMPRTEEEFCRRYPANRDHLKLIADVTEVWE